jgi:hypothetical protein
MAGADLTDVRALAGRAQKQFDALKSQVDALLEQHPMSLQVDKADEWEIVRVVIPKQPPEDWWMDLGELAGNARSALDHLVYQLVIDSGNDPAGTRTQFPIFEVQDDYLRGGKRSDRERMLKGVATRHRKVIDDLQPYQRGSRTTEDPLAILRSVTDRHKHRERHTGVGFIEKFIPAGTFANGMRAGIVVENVGAERPLQDSDVVYRMAPVPVTVQRELTAQMEREHPERGGIEAGGTITGLQIEPDPQFTIVFLGDRIVKIADIERTIPYVAGIIERFERRIAGQRPRSRPSR